MTRQLRLALAAAAACGAEAFLGLGSVLPVCSGPLRARPRASRACARDVGVLALRAEADEREQTRKDLLARREAVLGEMQSVLEDEETRIANELKRLQDEKFFIGTEEWGDEQRQPPDEADENEEDLPSDWDSLPWSDGYKKAMQRADARREERRQQLDEQGIVGNGAGIGNIKRSEGRGGRRGSMQSIVGLLIVGSAVVAGTVSWQLDDGNNVIQQQLDLVNLVADCQNGISYFRSCHAAAHTALTGCANAVASRGHVDGHDAREERGGV